MRKSVYGRILYLLPVLLLISLVFSAGCGGNSSVGAGGEPIQDEPTPQEIEVQINPPEEFDFLNKSDIYEIRKKFVNAYPSLLKAIYSGEYQPSEEVFGQIEDGKSWWGTLGIYYYGPGEKSIEGPSEESRFICNPYIPVALCERWARGITDPEVKPEAIFPRPLTVKWDITQKVVNVKYNVEDYLKKSDEVGDSKARELKLIAYNAKDLGYRYFYIYPDQLENITITPQDEALLIPQFLHVGTDSGYPGGSNNMSPGYTPLNIELKDLPAKLVIALWKEKPSDLKTKPDFMEIMEME